MQIVLLKTTARMNKHSWQFPRFHSLFSYLVRFLLKVSGFPKCFPFDEGFSCIHGSLGGLDEFLPFHSLNICCDSCTNYKKTIIFSELFTKNYLGLVIYCISLGRRKKLPTFLVLSRTNP